MAIETAAIESSGEENVAATRTVAANQFVEFTSVKGTSGTNDTAPVEEHAEFASKTQVRSNGAICEHGFCGTASQGSTTLSTNLRP
mmetsp:Transcript_71551/g.140491  ORF Transcript_71551/g.140491 Transcript_71551/m.140491 type:complete len:86 (-) Transcript_71551:94-351(-)